MHVTFYSDPRFERHSAGYGHPERPERLEAIESGLEAAGLFDALEEGECPVAAPEDLERVHAGDYVRQLLESRGRPTIFDGDTRTNEYSIDAAERAAGAVIEATKRAVGNPQETAFCAVRPPGHHAEANRAMGFCLFNNIAVAAAYAVAALEVERVFIFDPDVHHGNGTQHIFEARDDVMYCSIHQFPFYPGTGDVDEVGRGDGKGFTANLPLPGGCGDAEYAYLGSQFVAPLAEEYDPELLLISAGFDAHRDDPLGGMRLSAEGFLHTLAPLCRWATEKGVPYLFALEGGYALSALQETVPSLIRTLVDDSWPAPSDRSAPRAEKVAEALWRNLGRKPRS